MIFRRALGVVLLVVSFNFLFVSNSLDHTKIGWIWLVLALLMLWPDFMRLLRRLGVAK